MQQPLDTTHLHTGKTGLKPSTYWGNGLKVKPDNAPLDMTNLHTGKIGLKPDTATIRNNPSTSWTTGLRPRKTTNLYLRKICLKQDASWAHWLEIRHKNPCTSWAHWLEIRHNPCTSWTHWLEIRHSPCTSWEHWLEIRHNPCTHIHLGNKALKLDTAHVHPGNTGLKLDTTHVPMYILGTKPWN